MYDVPSACALSISKYSSVSGSQSQTGSNCARRGTVGSMLSLKHVRGHLFRVIDSIGCPVDIRIVFTKPVGSQEYVMISSIGDEEVG